jgi:hypothetical protein
MQRLASLRVPEHALTSSLRCLGRALPDAPGRRRTQAASGCARERPSVVARADRSPPARMVDPIKGLRTGGNALTSQLFARKPEDGRPHSVRRRLCASRSPAMAAKAPATLGMRLNAGMKCDLAPGRQNLRSCE